MLSKFEKFKITTAAIEAAEEQEFILNGSIPKNRITTIYAAPNQGKTTFGIAISLLSETYYLDAENPLDTFPKDISKHVIVYSTSMGASDEELSEVLLELANESISDSLIIIDTLMHFANPNDNQEVMKLYSILKKIRDNSNTIVVLHHTNKGNPKIPDAKKEFFGSSVIKGQTDTMLYLEGFEDDENNVIVTLVPEKKRGYMDQKSYKVSTLNYSIEEIYEEDPEQLHKDKHIVDLIISFLSETRTTTEILDYLITKKISTRKSGVILNRYADKFWIKGGNGKKRQWTLKPQEDNETPKLAS